jgi:glycerol uptake facilitator protein
MSNIFLAEFTGTALLVTLGNGVVANVVLPKTKGHGSGWIVISFGWAIAVFVGVYTSAASSGAHLNPAISLAFAFLNKISWASLPVYIAGQLLGAMTGAIVVWAVYHPHFSQNSSADEKLAVFCTGPAIRTRFSNLVSEIVGTFVLVFGALHISAPSSSLGAIDALPVALLVLGIGLSLGGTTGYAINPARDLGPRLMHAVLPIPQKRDSDWSYSWIPVAGPLLGGLLGAVLYSLA